MAAACLALLVSLYLPGLVGGSVPCFRDVLSHHLGWRLLVARQLAAHQLPLVDDATTAASPLLADPNTMALYPSTLFFLVLPPASALALHFLIHHLLLALGAFLLLRRMGHARRSALAGAAFAAGAGIALSQLAFTNSMAALAWVPWLVWSAVRVPAERAGVARRIAAAAIIGACSWLAGEPVIAAVGWILWLAALLAGGPAPRRRLPMLAAPVLAFLLAAPLLAPFASVYPASRRAVLGLPPGSVAADAFRPRRWPEIVLPHLYGAPGPFAPDGFWAAPSFPWLRYEVNLHVGVLALVLLSLGTAGRRRRAWLVLGLVAVVAAAVPGVIEAAARHVPVLAGFRYQIKLLILAQLAFLPLLAAGFAAARHRPRALRRRCLAAGVLVLAVAAPLLTPGGARRTLSALFPASAANLARPGVARSVAGSVRGDLAAQLLPLAAAAAAPRFLLLPALVTQLFAEGRSMFIWDRWRRYASPSPVMAATAADPRVAETVAFPSGGLQPTPERGVPAPVERSRLGFAQGWRYYGVLHGVHYRGAEGPDGLEPWWTADAARRLAGSSPERLAHAARHLGIAYLLRSRRLPAGADVAAVTAIRAAGAEVLVHRLTRPAPACWMAAREIAVPSRAAAWHQLEDAASRPGADAVVLAPASGVRSHGPGSARLLARSPASWRVATSSAGAGLLVLDAAFSPSWIVRVDGRRTAPVLVNLCRIGVRVPPGDHRVTLTWSTRPFGTGLLLAAFGWTIVGWLGLIAARDRRRPPSDAPGPRRPASPPGR